RDLPDLEGLLARHSDVLHAGRAAGAADEALVDVAVLATGVGERALDRALAVVLLAALFRSRVVEDLVAEHPDVSLGADLVGLPLPAVARVVDEAGRAARVAAVSAQALVDLVSRLARRVARASPLFEARRAVSLPLGRRLRGRGR